jgi:hypothetical protein
MPKTLSTALAGALAALCLAPAAAPAQSPDLWATVNVCDTKKHANQMGVRARMPGTGERERMYMRFTAQFRKGGGWKRVANGRSDWIAAGSATLEYQERGFTFPIMVPDGASYLLRGVVRFEWRKGKRVTRRRRTVTAGGHPSRGADPKGFSASKCRIE